jgi:hypothetical protein
MQNTTGLQEIIYVSTLAADAPIRVVADIASRARSTNRTLGITGLLVFDGMHFCQQLEGSQQEVAALMERIRQDPRHTHVAILHNGPLDKRRFKRFSLGYTSAEDVEALERLQQLQGQAAVDAFVALLSGLDVDG